MKKFFLTMLGVAMVFAPASAQVPMGLSVEKVDVDKLKAQITKSDAEIADAKKAAKAATWIKRGDMFLEIDGKPVNGVFVGMDENILKLTYGDAAPESETIDGKTYTVYTYEHFKVYMTGGLVEFFVATTVVDPSALDKAYDAFAKAYSLDAKQAKKVGEGMGRIRVKSFENGSTFYALRQFLESAENFRRAYKATDHPAYEGDPKPDLISLYYAGMAATTGSDFKAALEDLDKVIELGYDEQGDAYRLKFVALYNLERRDKAFEALKAGMELYPTNENLIDMMMRYYAENDGDPTSLIPMVEEAIAKNPENPSLYQGLARVYDKLGQIDNAIEAIKKAVELIPEDFLTNYLEGLYIVKKGDEMHIELGKQNFTSGAQYQQALAVVNDVFREALAPLEKAYSLSPDEIATVELLKNLSYRLREDDGGQTRYDKYNELYKSMETAQ